MVLVAGTNFITKYNINSVLLITKMSFELVYKYCN